MTLSELQNMCISLQACALQILKSFFLSLRDNVCMYVRKIIHELSNNTVAINLFVEYFKKLKIDKSFIKINPLIFNTK